MEDVCLYSYKQLGYDPTFLLVKLLIQKIIRQLKKDPHLAEFEQCHVTRDEFRSLASKLFKKQHYQGKTDQLPGGQQNQIKLDRKERQIASLADKSEKTTAAYLNSSMGKFPQFNSLSKLGSRSQYPETQSPNSKLLLNQSSTLRLPKLTTSKKQSVTSRPRQTKKSQPKRTERLLANAGSSKLLALKRKNNLAVSLDQDTLAQDQKNIYDTQQQKQNQRSPAKKKTNQVTNNLLSQGQNLSSKLNAQLLQFRSLYSQLKLPPKVRLLCSKIANRLTKKPKQALKLIEQLIADRILHAKIRSILEQLRQLVIPETELAQVKQNIIKQIQQPASLIKQQQQKQQSKHQTYTERSLSNSSCKPSSASSQRQLINKINSQNSLSSREGKQTQNRNQGKRVETKRHQQQTKTTGLVKMNASRSIPKKKLIMGADQESRAPIIQRLYFNDDRIDDYLSSLSEFPAKQAFDIQLMQYFSQNCSNVYLASSYLAKGYCFCDDINSESFIPNKLNQKRLLQALAVLIAKDGNLVSRLFEPRSHDSLFKSFWLCVRGDWQIVTVTNALAFSGNTLLMSRCAKQAWPAFIEKAIRKVVGCRDFEQLQVHELIEMLGGMPVTAFKASGEKTLVTEAINYMEHNRARNYLFVGINQQRSLSSSKWQEQDMSLLQYCSKNGRKSVTSKDTEVELFEQFNLVLGVELRVKYYTTSLRTRCGQGLISVVELQFQQPCSGNICLRLSRPFSGLSKFQNKTQEGGMESRILVYRQIEMSCLKAVGQKKSSKDKVYFGAAFQAGRYLLFVSFTQEEVEYAVTYCGEEKCTVRELEPVCKDSLVSSGAKYVAPTGMTSKELGGLGLDWEGAGQLG